MTGVPELETSRKDAIDFGARADVDALGRFVGDDQARLREQGARHHDFLLIAAGQRQDRRFKARPSLRPAT